MKRVIDLNNEPNGSYSIKLFLDEGIIEYPADLHKDDLYIHDSKLGDHVTILSVDEGNIRKTVWAERVADKELFSTVDATNLGPIVESGECITLLKNINDDEDQASLYVPFSEEIIPQGFIGIVKHPDKVSKAGSIVITPSMDILKSKQKSLP
jgi:hypothetical protein